jgi:acetyl esterase/lipase
MTAFVLGIVALGLLQTGSQGTPGASRRFDFGPAGSVAARGFTAVAPDAAYSRQRGYGFVAAPSESGVIDRTTTTVDARFKYTWRVDAGMAWLNDLTRDYVAGPAFRFRVDVPNGRYDVVATLGYKHPLRGLRVTANGREVARELAVFTYHYSMRGFLDDTSVGASYALRFTSDVAQGQLELAFAGEPRAALMGLTVTPHRALAAFSVDGDKLGDAEERARSVKDPLDRAWAYMTLAGRPEAEDQTESRCIRRAREILRDAARKNPSDVTTADLLEQTEQFIEAVRLFNERDAANSELATIGHFHMAHALWRQFIAEHPFHWKGLLYSGRMYDGPLWYNTSVPLTQRGLEILREVETRFPRNRYVRLHLHQEWTPKEWKFAEYPAPAGTPRWAEVMRRAFCQALDFGEWWADFRQRPNGSIGGGWNDDVEIMPVWVMNWSISPEASPKIGRMLEKFTEGEWASGNLDRRRAFSAAFSDAEHAAEDQGDSLPYLTGVLYGNPRYLDWNLRTLEYFGNYLTGVNKMGRRHFRSTDFDSTRYATDLDRGAESVEAAICYRAFGTLGWMVWYNGNTAAKRLLVEHADSWLAAALSTQKGKPRGVMPNQLGFDDTVGGPEPTWTGKDGLGAGGKWPDYMHYIDSLMLNAFAVTGDRKYLAPFEETFALLERIRAEGKYAKKPDAPPGTEIWVYNLLVTRPEFADALWMVRELTGERRYDPFLLQVGRPYVRYRLTLDRNILAEDIEQTMNKQLRERWPHMTSEGVLTDRIGYNPRTVSYMTGGLPELGYQGIPHHAVTYTGTGRDFASVVETASKTELRLVYYSFAERPRQIGVRPWKLEPGARYRVTAGGETREITLAERGESIAVNVPPRQEVTVRFEQIAPAPAVAPRADLGLTQHDIRWNEITDQIEATIHNVGSADARNIEVAFYNGKQLLERAVITRIGAPNDLHRETITVGTWRHRNTMTEGDVVTVVVDPDGKIPEITRANNSASWRLTLSDAAREQIATRRSTFYDRRANAGGTAIQQIRLLTDVPYGDDDPDMQRLDAYLVSSPKPTPVVIEFHGGGWRNGEKSDLEQYGGFLRALLAQGYSLISANYRLTPKAVWPAQGDDARRVLDFVRGKAKEWNLDPERIALIGGSAGAHLALQTGLPAEARVRAIIDLWGPSDLELISPRVPRGEALTALLDATVEEYEKPGPTIKRAMRDASPIHRVTAKSPPVFIVHDGPANAAGPTDPRISGANMGVHSAAFGLTLAARLKEAGVAHEVVIAPDAGRTFHKQALEFLKRNL